MSKASNSFLASLIPVVGIGLLGLFQTSCTVVPNAQDSSRQATLQKSSPVAEDVTFTWCGYSWTVKSASGMGPGPNNWSPNNAYVDANGYLHLKITHDASGGNGWNCAEIYTNSNLGFGTYQWQVEGSIDSLDKNVVLGFFPYGPPNIGVDGTNEIDIEYSRWANASGNNGWWTTYPNSGSTVGQLSFPFSLSGGTYTTSRFTWNSTSVAYRLMGGFQAVSSTTNTIKNWTYAPSNPSVNIPQQAMPLHINLWLYQGQAPSNGQPVEVIIHNFTKA